MKYVALISSLLITLPGMTQTIPIEEFSEYPQTQIENEQVTMKLFLPDPNNGFYRATRFDWSGIISSLQYKGHEYFGYWKSTHDPTVHEDLTGPVESYGMPGPGFDAAAPGGKFIRIGVGVLERPDDKPYETFKTYKILDHGEWDVRKGEDWIEFEHRLQSDFGYGYVYTKRIALKTNEPGFTMTHKLENTGDKTIETDQYNHNFFMIDGKRSGPGIVIEFPYPISTENDLKGLMSIDNTQLQFIKNLEQGNSIWMEFDGYGQETKDHQVNVVNKDTGAGVRVRVDQPLYSMVFWACHTTYCPENFIYIRVDPGETTTWVSDYMLYIE